MDYVRTGTAIFLWDPHVILAYLTSNVDKNRNFHAGHGQTRARLYELFV
jgi:hypothetical protein